jgi:hypothetical protein
VADEADDDARQLPQAQLPLQRAPGKARQKKLHSAQQPAAAQQLGGGRQQRGAAGQALLPVQDLSWSEVAHGTIRAGAVGVMPGLADS